MNGLVMKIEIYKKGMSSSQFINFEHLSVGNNNVAIKKF